MLISDHLLLNYKRCSRRTFLEIHGDPSHKQSEKDFLIKLKRENQVHIQNVIQVRGWQPQRPEAPRHNWQLNAQQTLELMQQGADCIAKGTLSLSGELWQASLAESLSSYVNVQGELLSDITFTATPSLLIKQPGQSCFGDWSYLPINIKLGRKAKPEYKLIGAYQAQILSIIQQQFPIHSSLILKEQNECRINLDHWLFRMQQIVSECLMMLLKQAEPEVFISRQRCNLCSWHKHCHEIARADRHLSLVPGVTPRRYEFLQELGVRDIQSLVKIPEATIASHLGDDVAQQLKQQIKAITSDLPQVKIGFDLINTQPIPSGVVELYFDIEAEPERQTDYLLGVLLVNREYNTEKFYPFLAEDLAEEGQIWQEFLDFVEQYPDAPIFHYSEYEADTIKRLGKLYNTPISQQKAVLSRLVDLHHWVRTTVIFPVESYSLKALANWIGFYWRDASGSGDQSVCWYDQWLSSQDRVLLDFILSYNEDDCRATRYLKDWLLEFLENQRNHQIALT